MRKILHRGQRAWTVLLSLAAVALMLCAFSRFGASAAPQAQGQPPQPFSAEYYSSPSDRFGFAFSFGAQIPEGGTTRPARITDYQVGLLYAGWYSDWRTQAQPLTPGGIKYAQIVLVRESQYPTNTLELTNTVTAAPKGSLWIVGNEPERLTQPQWAIFQGSRTPEEYAHIYHHVYGIIKASDPTAQVAIGGVVQPTPLRLQWLQRVLDEYQARYGHPMPIDVWNIHMQILPEKKGGSGAEIPVGLDATQGQTLERYDPVNGFYDNANPALFRQLVRDFRQWMKDQGFQDKPLIVSEYGVLLPSSYIGYGTGYGDSAFGDRVLITFMRETFDFMLTEVDPNLGYPADDNRLVQQWLWYSLNDRLPYIENMAWRGFNGSLFYHNRPTELTQFGIAWRSHMLNLLGYPKIMLPAVLRRSP